MVEKSSRKVCRVSRSTKLKLRSSMTLKRRKLQRSRTRFKRRRIQLKHSNIEQPQRRRRWLRCNRGGETVSKFKLQRTQELTRTQHEDGKQDAWNGHAQVASQAMAVPEEYGPDAERQEVTRDEHEFRTAQQQVKKTTLGRARRERSVIINECESDKTSRTKQFSQLHTWRNHALNATREVDKKLRASGERSTNQSTRTS